MFVCLSVCLSVISLKDANYICHTILSPTNQTDIQLETTLTDHLEGDKEIVGQRTAGPKDKTPGVKALQNVFQLAHSSVLVAAHHQLYSVSQ